MITIRFGLTRIRSVVPDWSFDWLTSTAVLFFRNFVTRRYICIVGAACCVLLALLHCPVDARFNVLGPGGIVADAVTFDAVYW